MIIFFSPNEQRAGGGGVRCQTSFVLFSLFSRPRAGLATVLSSFFGLATNALNVSNNNNNNTTWNPFFFAPLCEDADMCRDADMCEDPDDYGIPH